MKKETKQASAPENALQKLKPWKAQKSSGERALRWLVLVFAWVSFYRLSVSWRSLEPLLAINNFNWIAVAMLSLFLLLLMPAAVFLLYKRRKMGFHYLLFASVFALVNTLLFFLLFEDMIPERYASGPGRNTYGSTYMDYLLVIAFYGTIAWHMSREKVYGLLEIRRSPVLLTVAIGTVWAIVYFYLLMMLRY